MKNCAAVIAMVLPATVVLLWLSPAIHATTLCKADDPCIREWISALSGWVGGAAAIATILVINKHHRENVKLQNFPIFRTAQLAKESAAMLRPMCESVLESIERDSVSAIHITLKEIVGILGSEIVRDFELKIGVGYASGLIEAKALIGAILQAIGERPKPDPNNYLALRVDNGPLKSSAKRVAVLVLKYAELVNTSASAYIARYSNT